MPDTQPRKVYRCKRCVDFVWDYNRESHGLAMHSDPFSEIDFFFDGEGIEVPAIKIPDEEP